MRKVKDTWITVGVVIVFASLAFGLAYSLLSQQALHNACRQKSVGVDDPVAVSRPSPEMEASRNADTSNFDTVIRF